MRILFCNYEYPPLGGGGGVSNALLAEELANCHDVTVLTSQGHGLPADALENGVRVVRSPVFFRRQLTTANLASMFSYMVTGPMVGKKLLRVNQFDVINTHFVLPTGPVGDTLSRIKQIPNVLSLHGGDLYDPSKWMSPHRHGILRMWIRRLLRRADRIVGQSSNTLQNVRDFYDSEIQGIRIPLGIRRPPTETASRDKYGLGEKDVVLVTLGRLVARKAIDQIISVMKNLDGNVHLLIVGTGPQEPALREQAKALQIDKRIHFLGHVEETEKFKILHMSDIFVSTSQHEGFGLMFIEAMASGLPVICYDRGGQTDFLQDGITGHVVFLNDLTLFTDRCRRLAQDATQRRGISARNLKLVEEFFIDRCAEHYEDVFASVVHSYNKRRAQKVGYANRS